MVPLAMTLVIIMHHDICNTHTCFAHMLIRGPGGALEARTRTKMSGKGKILHSATAQKKEGGGQAAWQQERGQAVRFIEPPSRWTCSDRTGHQSPRALTWAAVAPLPVLHALHKHTPRLAIAATRQTAIQVVLTPRVPHACPPAGASGVTMGAPAGRPTSRAQLTALRTQPPPCGPALASGPQPGRAMARRPADARQREPARLPNK